MTRVPQTDSSISSVERWFRREVMQGWWQVFLSFLLISVLFVGAYRLLSFIFRNADWAQIIDKLKLLAVYFYPTDLLWRPFLALAILVFIAGLASGLSRQVRQKYSFYALSILISIITVIALLFFPSVRWLWCTILVSSMLGLVVARRKPEWSKKILPGAIPVSWLLAIVLLLGFIPDESHPLRFASPKDWGGILLSLFLPLTACALAVPLGFLLALGHQSTLSTFRVISRGLMHLQKAVPLIVWLLLFHAILAPIYTGVKVEPVFRAQLALGIFASVYMAELMLDVLKTLPKEQYYAAKSLGLNPIKTVWFIVVPQVLTGISYLWFKVLAKVFRDSTIVIAVSIVDLFALFAGVPSQTAIQTTVVDVTHETFFLLLCFYGLISFVLNKIAVQDNNADSRYIEMES